MRHRPLLESEAGRAALDGLCEPDRLSPEIAIQLVAAVQAQIGRARRHGLFDRLDEILAKEELE